MVDRSSSEFRQGWHECYMAVLKSVDESVISGLDKTDTILNLMADVRSAEK